jgi:hypothetical protein
MVPYIVHKGHGKKYNKILFSTILGSFTAGHELGQKNHKGLMTSCKFLSNTNKYLVFFSYCSPTYALFRYHFLNSVRLSGYRH